MSCSEYENSSTSGEREDPLHVLEAWEREVSSQREKRRDLCEISMNVEGVPRKLATLLIIGLLAYLSILLVLCATGNAKCGEPGGALTVLILLASIWLLYHFRYGKGSEWQQRNFRDKVFSYPSRILLLGF